MPDFLCSFDIGTSGVKAGILTPDGQMLCAAHREYDTLHPEPGWVEQSIEEMWKAQCEASQELVSQCEISPKDIGAVSVSCQRATFVPVDEEERPLMNFIGWQDQRGLDQCKKIKRLVSEKTYYDISGLTIDPIASVSKILWLKENYPEIFEKAHKFVSTQNVHLHQLGVRNSPCDLPSAAYIGLLDVNELEWSSELLRLLAIPAEKLPSLVPSGTVVGEISSEASRATGLAQGTPIVTAGGDLQCAGLGVGVAKVGVVSIMIGTGADVVTFLNKPVRHPEMALNCLPHTAPGAWEMEGICLSSGGAYRWFRDEIATAEKQAAKLMGEDAYESLNRAAAHAPPGSHGVMVIPTFSGAGAPNWYPKARGVILGLDLATDKRTLSRAVLEGVCFEIRWMLEAIKKLNIDFTEIRICGGASKSSLWNQISADIYGLPTVRTKISDSGLVGAAICSGIGVGIFRDAEEGARSMVRIAEVYEPNPGLRSLYDEMFEIFKAVYTELEEGNIFERLDALRHHAAVAS